MTRISKQAQKRHVSRRSTRKPSPKTGALKDKLPLGYKAHTNAVEGEVAEKVFIPKIR